MTIERERFNGPISFLCDGARCHEFCETNCEELSGALAKMKSRGWTARKERDEWVHLCRDCK